MSIDDACTASSVFTSRQMKSYMRARMTVVRARVNRWRITLKDRFTIASADVILTRRPGDETGRGAPPGSRGFRYFASWQPLPSSNSEGALLRQPVFVS